MLIINLVEVVMHYNINYKIGYQNIKGKWSLYFSFLGLLCLFINRLIGLIILFLGVLSIILYKKSSYNQSAIRFNYAMNYIKEGKNKQAKIILLDAIEQNKLNKEAYFFVGCILFEEEDYTNALEYLKMGGADNIADDKLTYAMGICYYHIENFKTAIDKLNSISFEDNDELESCRLFVLGKSYSEIEEYEKSYTTLINLKKDNNELKGEALEYNYYLGVNCYYLDKIEEAKKYLKKVYSVDKNYKYINLYKDCI